MSDETSSFGAGLCIGLLLFGSASVVLTWLGWRLNLQPYKIHDAIEWCSDNGGLAGLDRNGFDCLNGAHFWHRKPPREGGGRDGN